MHPTKQFIKKLYKTFVLNQRPEMAVDVIGHCLSCAETQETHDNLPNLKSVTIDDFRLCRMSIESLSESAFLYYMPKLLEKALTGEKATKGLNRGYSITDFLLSQLIPNKHGNRFENYSKDKIEIIIEVVEQIHKKHFKEDYGYWHFNSEYFVEEEEIQEIVANCEKALEFWRNKLT